MFDIDHGIVSNSTEDLNQTLPIVAFLSLALYNVLELAYIILFSFRNRHGLYFWSFCVATFGIVPYSLSFLFKGLGINENAIFAYVTFIVLGWVCIVTGQSVVLYSRLHLVDRNRNHLRFVLAMIIVNGVVVHTSVAVLIYGANSSAAESFLLPYSIAEKVQVSIFFVQECIISLLYILATLKFFRGSMMHASSTKKRILRHLILVNCTVILLDVTILGLEYSGLYQLQTSYKAFVYSVKLKLEFGILNKLMDLTKSRSASATTGVSEAPCVPCQQDFIFDGSQQAHTCREGTMALGRMDGSAMQQSRQRTRKGEITIAADMPPPVSAGGLGPDDGIRVMTTTSVNVTRDDDFERQWRSLRRISSETEPPGECGMAADARKSASSSEAALTKHGA